MKTLKRLFLLIASAILAMPALVSCHNDEPADEGIVQNEVFSGTTTTKFTMGGQEMTYENKGIKYRVVLDTHKSDKATIEIIDASFAQGMPVMSRLVLQDLAFSGTTIEGTDIVPFYEEGGELIGNPTYKFESIRLDFTNREYSRCEIDFTVTHSRMGSFQGHFISD